MKNKPQKDIVIIGHPRMAVDLARALSDVEAAEIVDLFKDEEQPPLFKQPAPPAPKDKK